MQEERKKRTRKGSGGGSAAPDGEKAPLKSQINRGCGRPHRGGFAQGWSPRDGGERGGAPSSSGLRGTDPGFGQPGHRVAGARPHLPGVSASPASSSPQVPPAGCKGRPRPPLRHVPHPDTPRRPHRSLGPRDSPAAIPGLRTPPAAPPPRRGSRAAHLIVAAGAGARGRGRGAGR